MRFKDHGRAVAIWISKKETRDWAHCWPCSGLSGRSIKAEFDDNGLLELTVDGKFPYDDADFGADEFNAITSDYLYDVLDKDHPCWYVCVGQFMSEYQKEND